MQADSIKLASRRIENGENPAAERPLMCLVLSTGRCGGTLLSNVVRAYPAVLSVSELFSAMLGRDLSNLELDGTEFWNMLSTPAQTDVEVILRCQIQPDELLYPAFAPRQGATRFNWVTGVPPLMQTTLPHLTNRPDDLYAKLEIATPNQPKQLLSEHLWWLFKALAEEYRPTVVIERSGGSLIYAAALMRLFPDAKIVHLFRDGRECAESMSRHARYKLAAIRAGMIARIGYDPYTVVSTTEKNTQRQQPLDISAHHEFSELIPDRITRASFDQFKVPLRAFGAMWSKIIAVGLKDLSQRSQVLTLDYSDLTAHPEMSIGRFLEFIGLERDPEQVRRIAKGIRPGRDVRMEVSEQQWNELTESCRLGMNRLYGRNGWT